MATVEVTSFVDFVKRTDAFNLVSDLVLFRGQPKKGGLLPGVARKDPRKDTTEQEKKVLEQLQLQGASMLRNVGTTALDLLVAAQHYGLKTRLLDWTSNPLAAMWFACANPEKGDVYVYALEADKFLVKDVYDKDPFTSALTRVFQPRLNNDRITAQEGWFTLHRYAKKHSQFVPLERNSDIQRHLHQFCVPEKHRSGILKSLDRHGVNARTIFPDLSGLCRHLNHRHELL